MSNDSSNTIVETHDNVPDNESHNIDEIKNKLKKIIQSDLNTYSKKQDLLNSCITDVKNNKNLMEMICKKPTTGVFNNVKSRIGSFFTRKNTPKAADTQKQVQETTGVFNNAKSRIGSFFTRKNTPKADETQTQAHETTAPKTDETQTQAHETTAPKTDETQTQAHETTAPKTSLITRTKNTISNLFKRGKTSNKQTVGRRNKTAKRFRTRR